MYNQICVLKVSESEAQIVVLPSPAFRPQPACTSAHEEGRRVQYTQASLADDGGSGCARRLGYGTYASMHWINLFSRI
jgi:hypothetical protein